MNNPSNTINVVDIISKVIDLFSDLFKHDGFGDIRIEIKILKRGQKEVIIHCGKQYRYVVNNLESQDQINSLIQGLSRIKVMK
jgi:hypothetical protein